MTRSTEKVRRVIGGIVLKPHAARGFLEVAFCVVRKEEQRGEMQPRWEGGRRGEPRESRRRFVAWFGLAGVEGRLLPPPCGCYPRALWARPPHRRLRLAPDGAPQGARTLAWRAALADARPKARPPGSRRVARPGHARDTTRRYADDSATGFFERHGFDASPACGMDINRFHWAISHYIGSQLRQAVLDPDGATLFAHEYPYPLPAGGRRLPPPTTPRPEAALAAA